VIEYGGEKGRQISENESRLTNWGFRVSTPDPGVMGITLEYLLLESMSYEFQHFTRAGAAAVSMSLSRRNLSGSPQTNLLGVLKTPAEFLAPRTSQLFARGVAVLAAMNAVNELCLHDNIPRRVDSEETVRHTTYCLPVSSEDSEAEHNNFGEVFGVQGSGRILWVGVGFDQQYNGKGFGRPNTLVFSSYLEPGQTQSKHKTVFTALTLSDRPYRKKVEVQAGKESFDRGGFPESPQPDPDFAAARAFTGLINRTLKL
jgi:hypothetical protein